jgi:hypothetical protein
MLQENQTSPKSIETVKSSTIRAREWKQRNREHARFLDRKSNWKSQGIDVKEAIDIFNTQKTCQICEDSPASLHLDHCHATNKVRGMLCQPCNLGLGYYKDNPTLLRKAADYLERHELGINQTN